MEIMHWQRLLSSQRFGDDSLGLAEFGRTHFDKDYDRLIFSSAFRRLDRKTQVHPLAINDHVQWRIYFNRCWLSNGPHYRMN